MTAHAELGASGAHRWMKCPGSIRMSEGQPDYQTDYAREGSCAHDLAQRVLLAGPAVDCDVYLGVTLEGCTVDEEMVENVQVYVDTVREAFAGADGTFVERRFSLEKLNPPAPMFGTSDAGAWFEEEKFLDVYDLKYGYLEVDAEENKQLMYYALGAVIALHVKPKRIRVNIVQPRGREVIRRFEFGWEELVTFKKELFAAACATLEPDAPLVIGDHCRFCKALAVCPEQERNAIEVAREEFAAQPVPAPEAMTVEQVKMVLEKAPLVEEWFKAVRAYVAAKIEAGEEVEGWKLVEKRATRKWTREGDASIWCHEHGINEPYVQKLKTPAQIEADLKLMLPRGKKKLAKEMLAESGLVEAKSSGFNLVPAHDPRPAANVVQAVDEFAALPAADSQTDTADE